MVVTLADDCTGEGVERSAGVSVAIVPVDAVGERRADDEGVIVWSECTLDASCFDVFAAAEVFTAVFTAVATTAAAEGAVDDCFQVAISAEVVAAGVAGVEHTVIDGMGEVL